MALGIERSDVRAEPLVPFLRRNWQVASVVVMAVIGIAVGIFLTTEHYAKVEPFCPTVGPINCSSVLRSQYSVVPLTGSAGSGVPITVPGALFFLGTGALAIMMLVRAYRGQQEQTWLRPALLLLSLAGLLFVLYLVFAEIVLIHSICLWCTGVHILTLLTFMVALSLWQQGAAEAYAPPSRTTKSQATTRQVARSQTTSRVAQTARARAQLRRVASSTGNARTPRR